MAASQGSWDGTVVLPGLRISRPGSTRIRGRGAGTSPCACARGEAPQGLTVGAFGEWLLYPRAPSRPL